MTVKDKGRPTLRTISKLSGLAVTTVSRALGDAPDISDETKKRIRKIAKDVGYVPNRAGVRLRTGRTNVIGLILETEHDIMNMTARLIASIANGLRGTPYHLVMTPETPDADPLEAVRHIVETGAADAVIINRTQPEDPRVAYLREKNFPFVTHGRTNWSDSHAYFDYDNGAFGRIAVQQLAQRGRSKTLMLAPPRSQTYARDMINSAGETAAALGTQILLPEDISSDSLRDELVTGLRACLDADPDIDSLISASPNATMVAAATLEEAGRTLGADIDVFSKETVPVLKLFRREILTLTENVEMAGEFLAKAAMAEVTRQDDAYMQAIETPHVQEVEDQ